MRPLFALAALVIVLAAIKLASSIVVPLLLAVALAIAFRPVSTAMERHGAPRAATALVTISGVFTVLVVVVWIAGQAAATFVDAIPQYQDALGSMKDSASQWLDTHAMREAARALDRWDPTPIMVGWARDGLFGFGQLVQLVLTVLLITIFIQLEATTYRRKLTRVLGNTGPIHAARSALDDVQRYFVVKAVLSAGTGLLLGLLCWACGLDNPLLWGVIATLLNFIPYIGSVLAAVPPVALSAVQLGLPTAGVLAVGYIGINLIENLVEPWLMGRALDISPLAVLVSMLLWGFVLGPVGVILSVPLTMTLRVVLANNEDLRWIATLLGGGVPSKAALRRP